MQIYANKNLPITYFYQDRIFKYVVFRTVSLKPPVQEVAGRAGKVSFVTKFKANYADITCIANVFFKQLQAYRL